MQQNIITRKVRLSLKEGELMNYFELAKGIARIQEAEMRLSHFGRADIFEKFKQNLQEKEKEDDTITKTTCD